MFILRLSCESPFEKERLLTVIFSLEHIFLGSILFLFLFIRRYQINVSIRILIFKHFERLLCSEGCLTSVTDLLTITILIYIHLWKVSI